VIRWVSVDSGTRPAEPWDSIARRLADFSSRTPHSAFARPTCLSLYRRLRHNPVSRCALVRKVRSGRSSASVTESELITTEAAVYRTHMKKVPVLPGSVRHASAADESGLPCLTLRETAALAPEGSSP
jgi:hypothetical protein